MDDHHDYDVEKDPADCENHHVEESVTVSILPAGCVIHYFDESCK